MAVDNSPVQNKIILIVGVVTLLTLASLKFVFDSYFDQMTDEVVRSKLTNPAALNEQRAKEQAKLTSGSVPISKAIADMAAKGRSDESLGRDLAPVQSDDKGPLIG